MDASDALKFVSENHDAVLATRKRDGSPQMSPITVGVDGDAIVISSRETAIKTKNARRDPNVSLCLVSTGFYGEWLQVDGTAEIVSLPDAMEGLVDYYRNISGEHPDWDEYRAVMQRDQRCLIKITPTRVGPTVSG